MLWLVQEKEHLKKLFRKMARGVSDFLDKYAEKTKLENIQFVVYNNPTLAENMSAVLGKI